MPEPIPAWLDETFAGTLIPGARPVRPTRTTADGYMVINPDAFRAQQHADDARRQARREREQAAREREESPEAREARWREAKRQARMEMRRERRHERVAAGIEKPLPVEIRIDPAAMQAASRAMSAWCDDFAKTMTAAIKPVIEQFAAIGQGLAQMDTPAMRAVIKAAEEEQTRLAREAALRQTGIPAPHPDTLRHVIASFGQPSAQVARGAPPRPRYLPGTRHASKGGRW